MEESNVSSNDQSMEKESNSFWKIEKTPEIMHFDWDQSNWAAKYLVSIMSNTEKQVHQSSEQTCQFDMQAEFLEFNQRLIDQDNLIRQTLNSLQNSHKIQTQAFSAQVRALLHILTG